MIAFDCAASCRPGHRIHTSVVHYTDTGSSVLTFGHMFPRDIFQNKCSNVSLGMSGTDIFMGLENF